MRSTIFTVSLFLVAAGISSAAELHLRNETHSAGALVVLGDVAEIHAAQPEATAILAAIDLFPAPPAGESRTLKLRELQDMLAVRGVNLAAHRFSGASQVTVRGPKRDTAARETPVRKPNAPRFSKRRVTNAAQAAIVKYLSEQDSDRGWQVNLELGDDTAEKVAALGDTIVASGSDSIDAGKQRFTLSGENTSASPVEVTATITLPPSVVVAKTPLPKGVILRADDLKLQPGVPTKGEATVFTSIDEVVGKETIRAITEDQILDDHTVRRPLLVRRNEIITVYSRTSGISVRTTGRSRADGSDGDLVQVEGIETRKVFLARVSGPQEVEIFAQGVSVGSEPREAATAASAQRIKRAAPPAPLPEGAVRHASTTQPTPGGKR